MTRFDEEYPGDSKYLAMLAEVEQRLGQVRYYAECENDEPAHMDEDKLHQYALGLIENAPGQISVFQCAELARQALKTLKMGFERWYA